MPAGSDQSEGASLAKRLAPPEYPGWILAMQGQYRANLPAKD